MPTSRNRKKHKEKAAKRGKKNFTTKNKFKEDFLKWAAKKEQELVEKENLEKISTEIVAQEV